MNYGRLPYCRDFIMVEPPITCVSNNCTINGPPFLYVVVDDTVSGAEYVLSVAETVTTIGSSVWDFIGELLITNYYVIECKCIYSICLQMRHQLLVQLASY